MPTRPKLHGDKDRLIPPELRDVILAYLEGEGRHEHPVGRMAILLADQAGLRVSEICRLTVADCDIGRRPYRLLIRGAKHRDRDHVDEQPVGPYLAGCLEEWFEGWHTRPNFTVLKRERGAYSRQHVRRLVKAVHEACDVPEIYNVHSWRHGYGTRVYLQTKDLVFTSRMLRHRSTKPTERYVHMSKAIKEMEEVFGAIEGTSGATPTPNKKSRRKGKKLDKKARKDRKPNKKSRKDRKGKGKR